MSKPDDIAGICRVFAAEARVRVLQLLKQRALCVGALAARLHMSSAAVSQHLRVLRGAGLVEADRRGNFVHYRVNEKRLAECRRAMDGLLS